jgi:hypothetical protein
LATWTTLHFFCKKQSGKCHSLCQTCNSVSKTLSSPCVTEIFIKIRFAIRIQIPVTYKCQNPTIAAYYIDCRTAKTESTLHPQLEPTGWKLTKEGK